MPDHDAGVRVERRERHPVVVAVLEDRRVGAVAREHGVEIVAVAEVGDALAFEALAPAKVGPVARGRRAIGPHRRGFPRCGFRRRSRDDAANDQ
jgi:hypothetical protein